MEDKCYNRYNENIGAGYHTDTRLKSDPILKFGMLATLIEIECGIKCIKQEIEANKKYGREIKHLTKQQRLLKILLREAKDK